jgi:hypothetical protein
MPAHDLVGQLGDAAVEHDATCIQDDKPLSDVAHELQVLLDQQDGAAAFAVDALDDRVDLLHDRRLQWPPLM